VCSGGLYLGPCFERDSGEVVITVITGQEKQVMVAWPVVCPVGLCFFWDRGGSE
jgi:hypothetical protein